MIENSERRPDILIAQGSKLTDRGFIVGLRPETGRVLIRTSTGEEYKVPVDIYQDGYAFNGRGTRAFLLLPLNEKATEILKQSK